MTSRYCISCVLALFVGLAGCELVVPSSLGDVKCSEANVVGAPACAAGQVCTGQSCVACASSDTCGDKIDNDCNLVVDDGCESDSGLKDQSIDSLPDASHDSSVDVSEETGDAKPEVADTSVDAADTSIDVAKDTAVDSSGPESSVVDTAPDIVVVDVGPDTNGTVDFLKPCSSSWECKPGYSCIDYGKGKKCTKFCCGSQDCGDDNVCFGVFGGKICASALELNLQTGKKLPTEPCKVNSDCRSGRCSAPSSGICLDVCCQDTDCGASKFCQVQNGAWQCSATTKAADGADCENDVDCVSNYCGSIPFVGKFCAAKDCCHSNCSNCGYRMADGKPVKGCNVAGSAAACCNDADCGGSDMQCQPVEDDIGVFLPTTATVFECVSKK